MADLLTVETRTADLAPSGTIPDLRELKYTERWVHEGGWVLVLPATSAAVPNLLAEGAGIIVRNATTRGIVYSGPVNIGGNGAPVAVRSKAVDSTGRLTDVLTVYGADDLVWLADRVAHPSPLDADPTSAEHDVRTGAGSTVLLGYIDANAGPGAVSARRVAGLAVAADPTVGTSATWRARWQNLLVLCREIATFADLAITIRQVDRGLVATVDELVDRSAEVRFGVELGNLTSVTYDQKPASATAIYLGGQGEGVARSIVEAVQTGRRIERFVDRRDVADTGELADLADTELLESVGALSVRVTIADTARFVYGVDYQLGDRVGVMVDGSTVVDRVVAVETTINVAGVSRQVTLGSETEAGAAGLFAGLARIARRVNQLERI